MKASDAGRTWWEACFTNKLASGSETGSCVYLVSSLIYLVASLVCHIPTLPHSLPTIPAHFSFNQSPFAQLSFWSITILIIFFSWDPRTQFDSNLPDLVWFTKIQQNPCFCSETIKSTTESPHLLQFLKYFRYFSKISGFGHLTCWLWCVKTPFLRWESGEF